MLDLSSKPSRAQLIGEGREPDSTFGASDNWRYRSGTRPDIDRHAHSGWLPGPRAPPVSRYADMWGRVKPLLVSAQASVGVAFDAGRDLSRAQRPCRLPPRRGVQ